MAVRIYSVTSADVLDYLPTDPSAITASSQPLSTQDIGQYIERRASELTGVLEKAGLDQDNLDEDTTAQIQHGVIQGAVADCLAKLGHGSGNAAYRSALDEYQRILTRYTAQPQTLHQRGGSRVQSNVDTSASKASPVFRGISYKF